MRLGIATCAKCPDLTPSERPLISLLRSHGIEANPVVWNDVLVDWRSYDALLIRSVWDYHLHPDAFQSWLNQLDQLGIPAWNPTTVLRWNSHKFYLRDLAERGVDIVPTLFMTKHTTDGRDQAKARGWSDVVVKPAISASGYRTHSIPLSGPSAESILNEISSHGDFLIQPFLSTIRTSGEVSLIFFNEEYSHAVLKQPREGDFRVQAEYGGRETVHLPDKKIIDSARKILELAGMPILYARVDGVVEQDRLLLMELELMEPDLFLGSYRSAIDNFVFAIKQRIETYPQPRQ